MDEIVPGLWLGPLPFQGDIPVLKRNNILSILTIDILPLDPDLFKDFNRKFLPLMDDPTQNLLEILEESLNFIEHGLKISSVLVHCAMGVSRSASVVIAYLMRLNRLSYEEAYNLVLNKRSVFPNVGFINQLKLFFAMNWTVDHNSPLFIEYMSKKKFGNLLDLEKVCEYNQKQEQVPASFRCRKCRKNLFNSNQLKSHHKPEKLPEIDSSLQPETQGDVCSILIRGVSLNDAFLQCDKGELFTDSLDWTVMCTGEVEGKLYCPGCKSKVGSFNWCGEPCVCGTWVVPAFHFIRSHIDCVPIHVRPRTTIGIKPKEKSIRAVECVDKNE